MGVAAALPGGHEQRGIPADAREDTFHCTPSSLPTDCLVKRAERTASERRGNRYGQNVSHSLVARKRPTGCATRWNSSAIWLQSILPDSPASRRQSYI